MIQYVTIASEYTLQQLTQTYYEKGHDDATAILLAIHAPNLELVGVSTVCSSIRFYEFITYLIISDTLLSRSTAILMQPIPSPTPRAVYTPSVHRRT